MKTSILLGLVSVSLAAMGQVSESPNALALLTVYSPEGPSMLEFPGRKSWAGHLWLDHGDVGRLTPGHFLTLKLREGEHCLAGERFSFMAHESDVRTVFTLHSGQRSFMRLVIESKAVAGFGPTRWLAEPVTCQEASHEAAAAQPVLLKRLEKSALDQVAREPFFPECTR